MFFIDLFQQIFNLSIVQSIQSSVFQPRFRGTHKFCQFFTGFPENPQISIIFVIQVTSKLYQRFLDLERLKNTDVEKTNLKSIDKMNKDCCYCSKLLYSALTLSNATWSQFHQHIYFKLLLVQIPKAQKYSQKISHLHLWNLQA